MSDLVKVYQASFQLRLPLPKDYDDTDELAVKRLPKIQVIIGKFIRYEDKYGKPII